MDVICFRVPQFPYLGAFVYIIIVAIPVLVRDDNRIFYNYHWRIEAVSNLIASCTAGGRPFVTVIRK